MAARRALRLAERQARALRPLPRPPQRIGQWREAQGLSPSPAGPGPLRDLPDWSFADGRPSPPWRGQQRRERERRDTACRALALSRSLEAAKRRGDPGRLPVQTSTDQYGPVQTSMDRYGAARRGEQAPPTPEAPPTPGHRSAADGNLCK
ncbi:39S ribosomal protein L52, mitochondrial isoform X2 [Motacilla alba alba]|uniref:39S ribosomal protein L52, mitochondrial isoform X2 n=1 Tax=Motacilla alba alba TaxID=1094192 RepID=UPI0018D4E50B|nr:39S ribosomal protein L52, mitochondrial isoform X2 [Motacilla alba alba]